MGFKLSQWAWNQTIAKASVKLVLLCLSDRANDETLKCFPGTKDIAKRTGLDRKSILSATKELERLGLIEITKVNGSSNRYSMLANIENRNVVEFKKKAKPVPKTALVDGLKTSAENGTG